MVARLGPVREVSAIPFAWLLQGLLQGDLWALLLRASPPPRSVSPMSGATYRRRWFVSSENGLCSWPDGSRRVVARPFFSREITDDFWKGKDQ